MSFTSETSLMGKTFLSNHPFLPAMYCILSVKTHQANTLFWVKQLAPLNDLHFSVLKIGNEPGNLLFNSQNCYYKNVTKWNKGEWPE